MIILELILIIGFEMASRTAIIISLFSMLVAYYTHVIIKTVSRQNLLNKQCDPEAFIEATLKRKEEKMTGVPKALIDLELTVGYIASGDFETAKNILISLDMKPFKKSATIMGMYYNNLMVCFIYLGDLEEAHHIDIYDLKPLDIKHKRLLEGIRMSRAELLFHQGLYDEVEDIFQTSYENEKYPAQKLNALYFLAKIDEVKGRTEEAKMKYQTIVQEGNGLWLKQEAFKIIQSY